MVSERVRTIIQSLLTQPLDQVDAKTSFYDLGLDSYDAVNLVMDFEDEFDIDISDEDMERINSIASAIEVVQEAVSKKAREFKQ